MVKLRWLYASFAFVTLAIELSACGSGECGTYVSPDTTSTPKPTPTVLPSVSPTPSPTVTPTSSPTPISSVKASLSPSLPYSVLHAGIQTPIMILFDGKIESSTLTTASFYISSQNNGNLSGTIVVGEDSESVTFIPSSAMKLGTQYTVNITNAIKDESGLPIQPFSTIFTTQNESYTLFVANNSSQGWLGDLLSAAILAGATGITNGIQAADYLCQQDVGCPNGRVCKSMIVDGVNRDATVNNGKGLDWVLAPYTSYQNNYNQFIGITGINSAVTPAVFAFPFINLIEPSGALPNNQVWTGMNYDDWTTSVGYTCQGWQSSLTSDHAQIGSPNTYYGSIIDAIDVPCSGVGYWNGFSYDFAGANELYCVVQP